MFVHPFCHLMEIKCPVITHYIFFGVNYPSLILTIAMCWQIKYEVQKGTRDAAHAHS